MPTHLDPDEQEAFEASPPAFAALRGDIPLALAWVAWEMLGRAIDEGDEGVIFKSVEAIKKHLHNACARATCLTGTPHVEGLYTFGSDRIRHLSQNAKRAVLDYEKTLRDAREKASLTQGKP